VGCAAESTGGADAPELVEDESAGCDGAWAWIGNVALLSTTVVPNGFALISAMASRALATGNQWFTDLTDEGLFYLQL
jgi:hypothetical protein